VTEPAAPEHDHEHVDEHEEMWRAVLMGDLRARSS